MPAFWIIGAPRLTTLANRLSDGRDGWQEATMTASGASFSGFTAEAIQFLAGLVLATLR